MDTAIAGFGRNHVWLTGLADVRDAFMISLNTTVWVSAAVAVAGAVLGAVLMPQRKTPAPTSVGAGAVELS